ncbi:hypothetical protein ANTRET_LOCUS10505 [Anthophora retusa]
MNVRDHEETTEIRRRAKVRWSAFLHRQSFPQVAIETLIACVLRSFIIVLYRRISLKGSVEWREKETGSSSQGTRALYRRHLRSAQIWTMENEETTTVVSPKTSEGVTGWIESVVITTSQTLLGKTLFKLLDSFLWGVEKSAQWSLPSHEVTAEENGKVFGKIELVRPLPWFLFLPGLVILRIIRSGLNVGAFIFGYPQIQPSGMVKFVQKTRRRLRAMNMKAVKSARRKMCNNKDKRLTMIEAKKALIKSIRLTLSTLSCLDTSKSSPSPPPTKIRITNMDLEPAATPDEKSTTESVGSPIHPTEMKRKFSQVSSDEGSTTDESESETLSSKLDRLTADNSTDDPDFNLAECSTESSTASSDNEASNKDDVSFTELADILAQAKDNSNYDDGEKALFVSLEDLKSNSKKAEDTTDGVKRVDSSETEEQTAIRATNDFINGEINFAVESSPKVLSEANPTPEVIINRVVSEKQPSKIPSISFQQASTQSSILKEK